MIPIEDTKQTSLKNNISFWLSQDLPTSVAYFNCLVESSWNVMGQGDAREGKWKGNWRMEWVASTLHTTSERGVSSITTADAHTSTASSRLNWRPRRFKWTRLFRRKTKSGLCACAITFQTQSTMPRLLPPTTPPRETLRKLNGPRGRSGRTRKTSPPLEDDPRAGQPAASSMPITLLRSP